MTEFGNRGVLYTMAEADKSAGGVPESEIYPKAVSCGLAVEDFELDVSMSIFVPDMVLVEL